MNASVSFTRFPRSQPVRTKMVSTMAVRFGQTIPPAQPPQQDASAAEENPGLLKRVLGFVGRLFKIALEGLSWALGFEFIEALMHRLMPHHH